MSLKPPVRQGPILVVEDSIDDFEATQRAFRKAGLDKKIEHLTSGEAALAYLRTPGSPWPSLILLDLNMPGMGGRKTLEFIKKDETLKDIPVVVLTTSNYNADVRMCYALGANSYVQKPVDFDALSASIRCIKEYWLDTALLPEKDAAGKA
ncbi:MAG: response regulator [Alphaproteobacteria bacterium]|nr:MAG: response regulator [Alphaproteobacteria bacterium]